MEVEPIIHQSFGEILRAYRKRKRMTQKQLAQLLETHANTISSWELGTYLPQTRGLVLELARHLGLNDQETRQLLEASLTALSSHWHLPSPRNPFFTGREDILDTLHQCLSTNQASYVLHGLGGIGKTQIAVEYAYRHAQEYTAIFWIGAETPESIASSFLSIATLMGLPEHQESDQGRIAAAVRRWAPWRRGWNCSPWWRKREPYSCFVVPGCLTQQRWWNNSSSWRREPPSNMRRRGNWWQRWMGCP